MQNIKNLVAIGRISAVICTAALAGCSSTDSSSDDQRSQGRVKDDKSITEAVEKKLKSDPMYKFDSVHVNTFGGVVQLSGFVDDQPQARHAEEIARGVPGVAQVVNGMVMKPAPTGQPSGERLAPLAPTTSPIPNAGTQNY
ncbi:MAG TPA: BON domain-containing protein [Bryobacteraceae bacterium]|nr:BON domain-containing protein [Bryobacteraceae bacterium]